MRKLLIIAVAGVVSGALAPQAPAQDIGRIVHAITDPSDAHRRAEEARRGGHHDDELYWRRYEAGLHEQRAHEDRRPGEERYWHEYGTGLR